MSEYVYQPQWPNYLAFDYGFTNPFVALDVQMTPSDVFIIWREYYVTGLSDYKNALALRDRANPPGYQVSCGFGDAAGPGTGQTLWEVAGIPVMADPATKKEDIRMQGIAEIKRLLTPYEDERGRMLSHVYVHRSCKNTIFEFQNYRTKMSLREEQMNKDEKPAKQFDHALDAFRYLVTHLFILGARYHLEDVYEPPSQDLGPERPPADESPDRGRFTLPEQVFTLSGRNPAW